MRFRHILLEDANGFLTSFEKWAGIPGKSLGNSAHPHFEYRSGAWLLSLQIMAPDVVDITYIQVNPLGRRAGVGSKVMSALCSIADRHRVALTLIADETNDAVGELDDEDGYDNREHWLQNWYSSYGFDYTGETNGHGPEMRRDPQ